MKDLIAAVAEGGAVDDDQVPNTVLALALATMDQIEDDEEGIVAAVDYRFVKFYSSRFSVCLRRRSFTAVVSPFVFEEGITVTSKL